MKIIYTYIEKNYSKDRSLISQTIKTRTLTFSNVMKLIKSFWNIK